MYVTTIFLPLVSFLIVGIFGRFLGDRWSNGIACGCLVLSALLSIVIFNTIALDGKTTVIPLFTWFHVGSLEVAWALRFDTLSAVMTLIVTIISALVHIYSVGYMHRDSSIPRFMCYLSLFTFMMLMLITGENLVQVFFGWEGVGLASYLLIGFWHHKESANQASLKAFLVNRVGDFGFVIGLALIFFTFHTLDLTIFLESLTLYQDQTLSFLGCEIPTLEIIGILLFIGAMGKSAQIGLHTWLPDAMEGPTPVSALIHAATMVTAGVFLVARLSPLYELTPFARDIIIFIGATTALFAGTVALTQNDIKRIIAYSTCSQLGYMFFALGLSAYNAAIFHLFTHAFFKALLFLGAGSVIHGLSNEQDIRHMGGLARHMPFTCAMMWVGSFALAGIPFFAGYYSKDAILEAAWASSSLIGSYAYWIGIATACLTAFYSWRLLFMTFHGHSRVNETVMGHVHEPGLSMGVVLFLLSMGAIFSGYLVHDLFLSPETVFWRKSLITLPHNEALSLPLEIQYLPLFVAAIGIAVAALFYLYKPKISYWLAQRCQFLYSFLLHKWYFDELYTKIFVLPARLIGFLLWKKGDEGTIDAYGPDKVSSSTLEIANQVSRLQTGYIYHYALGMIMAVTFLAALYLFIKPGGF